MWDNGEKLDYQWVIKKVMWSLSTKFDYVVATIEEGKDIFTHIFEENVSSLWLNE